MVQYEWNKELCEKYANSLRPMVKFDHKPWAKKIAAHIDKSKNGLKILDIATGPGFLLIELAKHLSKPELFAQDATGEMLNIAQTEAQKHGCSVTKIHSKAEKIDVDDSSVDIATCKQLLHECDNPVEVISEMYRIAKTGGKIFIIDFDKNKGKFAARFVRCFMRFVKGKLISDSFWKSYTGGLEGEYVKKLLEKTGFENVKYLRFKYNYFIFGEKR